MHGHDRKDAPGLFHAGAGAHRCRWDRFELSSDGTAIWTAEGGTTIAVNTWYSFGVRGDNTQFHLGSLAHVMIMNQAKAATQIADWHTTDVME